MATFAKNFTVNVQAAAGGPGTGPAFQQPGAGAISLANGWVCSRDCNPLSNTATGSYVIAAKTFFEGYFAEPGGSLSYFFNGLTACFLDRGVFLYTPDLPRIFNANGMPASGPDDPVTWYTAGAVTAPVSWVFFAEINVGFTVVNAVFTDFNPGRGDTFSITQASVPGPYTINTTSWGSWIDFSGIGAGWVAFVGFDVSGITIGNWAL